MGRSAIIDRLRSVVRTNAILATVVAAALVVALVLYSAQSIRNLESSSAETRGELRELSDRIMELQIGIRSMRLAEIDVIYALAGSGTDPTHHLRSWESQRAHATALSEALIEHPGSIPELDIALREITATLHRYTDLVGFVLQPTAERGGSDLDTVTQALILGRPLERDIDTALADALREVQAQERLNFEKASEASGKAVEQLLVLGVGLVALLLLSGYSARQGMLRSVLGIAELGYRDPLTGLLNRAGLYEHYEEATSLAEGEVACLLSIDLDHFQLINEVGGYQAGDDLLIELTGVMGKELRCSDLLARVGADEFVVIVRRSSRSECESVAEDILSAIQTTSLETVDRSLPIGATIGVCHLPDSQIGIHDVLGTADAARRIGKNKGRNRTVVLSGGAAQQVQIRSTMDTAGTVVRSIREGRLRLSVQEIRPFTGGPLRCELLLRPLHPDAGELMPPAEIIAAAEEFGLIDLIDCWTVEAALELLAKGVLDAYDLVGVNLSARSIVDPSFLEHLEHRLMQFSSIAHRISFEITETALVDDVAQAGVFIHRISRLGPVFAIDDFGTGSPSFRLLKDLPFATLKIAGPFIRRLSQDKDDSVVRAFVDVARGLGMGTIAECLEDDEDVRRITQIGVDYGQGYALHRPTPIEGAPEVWTNASRHVRGLRDKGIAAWQ